MTNGVVISNVRYYSTTLNNGTHKTELHTQNRAALTTNCIRQYEGVCMLPIPTVLAGAGAPTLQGVQRKAGSTASMHSGHRAWQPGRHHTTPPFPLHVWLQFPLATTTTVLHVWL